MKKLFIIVSTLCLMVIVWFSSCTKEFSEIVLDEPYILDEQMDASYLKEQMAESMPEELTQEDIRNLKIQLLGSEDADWSNILDNPSLRTWCNQCKAGEPPIYLTVVSAGILQYGLPITAYRGTDLIASFLFQVRHSVSVCKTKCIVEYLGQKTAWDIFNFQPVNSSLPFSIGDQVLMSSTIPILPIYPKVRMDIEVQLINQFDQIICCFEFSMMITDTPIPPSLTLN